MHGTAKLHSSARFMILHRVQPYRVATSWQKLVHRADVRVWLQRELQLLLLEADVSIVSAALQPVVYGAPPVSHYLSNFLFLLAKTH